MNIRKVVGWLLVALLNVGLVSASVFFWNREIPPPQVIKVVIPEGAAVFPYEQVHAGTFKIDVSVKDLVEHAEKMGKNALISFGKYSSEGIGELLVIQYWVSRGDSTFFHASHRERIYWPMGIATASLERTSNEIRIIPMRGYSWLAFVSMVTLICGSVTAFVGVGKVARAIQRR